jgi:hypothetical protein
MKNIFLNILILFTSIATFAQTAKTTKTPEQRAEIKVAELNKLVSLNQEQKNNVYLIYLKQEMKYDIDSQNFVPNSPEAKKAEADRRDYVDTHLKMVLDQKQYDKLMQHRKELLKQRKSSNLLENDI